MRFLVVCPDRELITAMAEQLGRLFPIAEVYGDVQKGPQLARGRSFDLILVLYPYIHPHEALEWQISQLIRQRSLPILLLSTEQTYPVMALPVYLATWPITDTRLRALIMEYRQPQLAYSPQEHVL